MNLPNLLNMRLCPSLTPTSIRYISTTPCLSKNRAGKYKSTIDRSRMLTYEMAQRPHHIGIRKSWLDWHTQNLTEFQQQQGFTVAQNEIIRRFIRGFFYDFRTIDGSELIIKRRGNVVFVAGFLKISKRLDVRRIYWLFGFVEEFLSQTLKQPVKLELQFVQSEEELAYNYI